MRTVDYGHLNAELALELERCAAGDRVAFRRIYGQTAPKFLAIIGDIVRDDETARDIVQQGYLSIWRNAAKFDPEKGKAFTWMLVIMRNRALDMLRSQGRRGPTVELDEAIADAGDLPDRSAGNGQLRSILNQHLERLPQNTAEAIRLNVIQGYTCNEISELLDVPANTVKSWIRRGLITLKEQLPFTSTDAVI